MHLSGVAKSSTSFGWGKVTSAGWQVTLCDPIWHVISRSGVVISITNCYIRVYFTLQIGTTNCNKIRQRNILVNSSTVTYCILLYYEICSDRLTLFSLAIFSIVYRHKMLSVVCHRLSFVMRVYCDTPVSPPAPLAYAFAQFT